jgi:hypothetical protein
MKVMNASTEESIGSYFEEETGIKANKLMLSFTCWDAKSAEDYCKGRWRMFC